MSWRQARERRALGLPRCRNRGILDARLAGGSLRLIAVDLYGETRVAEDWHSDGSMRGCVRWRLKQPLELTNGGYRALVAGAGHDG